MAQLLVLTSSPAAEPVLPALELLSHRVRLIPAQPAELVTAGLSAAALRQAGLQARVEPVAPSLEDVFVSATRARPAAEDAP